MVTYQGVSGFRSLFLRARYTNVVGGSFISVATAHLMSCHRNGSPTSDDIQTLSKLRENVEKEYEDAAGAAMDAFNAIDGFYVVDPEPPTPAYVTASIAAAAIDKEQRAVVPVVAGVPGVPVVAPMVLPVVPVLAPVTPLAVPAFLVRSHENDPLHEVLIVTGLLAELLDVVRVSLGAFTHTEWLKSRSEPLRLTRSPDGRDRREYGTKSRIEAINVILWNRLRHRSTTLRLLHLRRWVSFASACKTNLVRPRA